MMDLNCKTLKLYIRDSAIFFAIFATLMSFPEAPSALAAVFFRGAGTAASSNNAVLNNIKSPSATQPGDIMIMAYSGQGTTAVAASSLWNLFANSGTADPQSKMWWRVSTTTGAQPADLGNSGNCNIANIAAFGGASTTAPIATSTMRNGGTNATTASGVTPQTPGMMMLYAHFDADDDSAITFPAGSDPNFNTAFDSNTTSGGDCAVGLAYGTTVASTTNTGIRSSSAGIGGAAGDAASASQFVIRPDVTLSGKIYKDEGTTANTATGITVKMQTSATSTIYSTTTFAGSDGTYNFQGLDAFPEGSRIKIWVDGDVNTVANLLTKASTTPYMDGLTQGGIYRGGAMDTGTSTFNLYQNRVIVRNEATTSTSTMISDFAEYDRDNDSDLQYQANGTLSVNAGNMLYIWPGTELAPGGAVTIHGGSTAAGQADTDGSLKLAAGIPPSSGSATSSILSMNGNPLVLAGSFLASSTPASVRAPIFYSIGTTTLNATSTVGARSAKNIIATSTAFYNLEFGTTTPGVQGGGSWSFGANQASTTGNFAVINGTTTLPTTLLDIGGNFSNTGRIITTTGTTTFNGTTTQYLSGFMVGTSTLNNVVLSGTGTTTFASNASTTNFFIDNFLQIYVAPPLLTLFGNYSNKGVFTANSGTVYIASTTATQYLRDSSACGKRTTLTDSRDGKIYNIVSIGDQCVMAQHLNVGTRITSCTGGYVGVCTTGGDTVQNQTNNAVIEKYCYSDNEANCTSDGGLYQWNEAMGYSASCNGTGAPPNDKCATPVQGICPAGWHIPSHYEWTTLEKHAGSNPGAFPYDTTTTGAYLGTDEGTNLKVGGSTGFNGILAGYRNTDGSFLSRGTYALIWSSLESGSLAWYRYLLSTGAGVARGTNNKLGGLSLRCLQD